MKGNASFCFKLETATDGEGEESDGHGQTVKDASSIRRTQRYLNGNKGSSNEVWHTVKSAGVTEGQKKVLAVASRASSFQLKSEYEPPHKCHEQKQMTRHIADTEYESLYCV